MSEAEAKTKMCCVPFMQTRSLTERPLCAGAACMGWRVVKVSKPDPDDPVGAPEGYCGMAGKP